ncbi:N-acetylglucosamine kinase-like BadF-type ATPase [Paenibacillus endophyticus]|uniref:N-acetylglucosamine kinase-like BadF-type ATPase n=1 Tax=Paenibacillus endophyticus TaxID=1294268 RepID=A0A7W5GBE1_9BACL|nr:BadF/BadG/BcrA/BcrD ATPase family protein [Paenibacillus endophyticus]MBB3153715.1 N-acetylglucosamine kinase-like BadF-type ATPase [Paenibacillus endophyticus]
MAVIIFLGIDAGGSKTHALLVDDRGRVLGRGLGGNGNHQTAFEKAGTNIEDACQQALQEAGIAKEQVTYAYFGLAGADREPDYEILRPMIASLGYEHYAIACDTMIGMRAGTNKSYGGVIISGTGFNAAARNAQGEELQYGGFGYLFGDGQGSGTDLAVHAFRSAIRAWEGREQVTLLSELVPERLGYATIQDMYDDALYNHKRPGHGLAKVMFEAAAQGDAVAIRILREAGSEHANAVMALIKRLGMEQERFDVVLTGSVLSRGGSPHMVDAINEELAAAAPYAKTVRLTVDPVIGAVMSAMDSKGISIDETVDAALRKITF